MTRGSRVAADTRSIAKKGKKSRSSPGSYIRISVAAAFALRCGRVACTRPFQNSTNTLSESFILHALVWSKHQIAVAGPPFRWVIQNQTFPVHPSANGGYHLSMIYLHSLPRCVSLRFCATRITYPPLFFLFKALVRCVSRCENAIPSKT